MSLDETTLLARLNDGRNIPAETCTCGHCKNEFFVAAISPEWMPSWCPFCGIKFRRKDTDGVPGDFAPKQTTSDEDDQTPTDDTWLHIVGGNYKYDSDDEIEDSSFIGWSTNRGHEIGPSVAIYEDGQLFLDGTGVPGVYLLTRGAVRKMLRAVGIQFTED